MKTQTGKYIFITLLALIISFEAKSQRYFANYMIVGTSLTYMRNSNIDRYKTDYGYDEYTWNVNLGIRLSKRVFTGLQLLNIYSSEISTPKDYYSVYGLFTQYNFFNKETHRLFAETSINRGNYCISADLPHFRNDLYYAGVGVGYDFPIKQIPNLYLDLSFVNYFILNNIENKYSYTQYVIGLNYRINER